MTPVLQEPGGAEGALAASATPPRTLSGLLSHAASEAPDALFLSWGTGHALTFAGFDRAAGRFATGLLAAGIEGGDRVAVLMDNRPESLVAVYGALRAGAVFVTINPQLTAGEITGVAAHAEARVLVAERRHAAPLLEDGGWPGLELVVLAPSGPACATDPDRGRTAAGGSPDVFEWQAFLDRETGRDLPAVAPDDLATIQYTSGTEAFPKGAMHSHRNLVEAFYARGRHLGYGPDDTMLIVTPLFHLNAQSVVVMALDRRFRVVLRERFSASSFWRDVQSQRVTTMNGLFTIPRILLARPPEAAEASNPLRTVVSVIGAEHHRAFEERFDLTLVPVYGLTEDPMPVLGPPEGMPGDGKLASAGRPVSPEVHQVRILDDDGNELPVGAVGEIVKKSPVTMLGYFRDPEATARVLDDGWLRTGDMGSLDEDGYLYFAGRKKDTIRRGGEMIAAATVEAAIAAHPAVAQAAVVGVADPIRGEEVKACVVLAEDRPAGDATAEELFAWCAGRLADFMVPRYLEIRARLPMTPTLKVKKDLLRAGFGSGRVWDRLGERPDEGLGEGRP